MIADLAMFMIRQVDTYIFQKKLFYQTVTDIDNDGKITLQIGPPLPEKRNDPLLECADAFCHYVKLHYRMIDAVEETK